MPQKKNYTVLQGRWYKIRVIDEVLRRLRVIEKRHPYLDMGQLLILLLCEGLEYEERIIEFEKRFYPGPIEPTPSEARILPFPRYPK